MMKDVIDQQGDILLIGGGSRIAGALSTALGKRACCVVRRITGQPREQVVADYATIPPEWFEKAHCVVQCVGTSNGSHAMLNRVNADLPVAIAHAARERGVKHFLHISSFSVYGRARVITAATPLAPNSPYGHSKLKADQALLELANNDFRVTILRLPLIYGGRTRGKLEQLIALWLHLRVLPVPAADVRRAMIGVDLTAHVILHLLDAMQDGTAQGGVVLAADPRPFTYVDAARAHTRRLYRLPLPTLLTKLAERVAPGVSERLFADSILPDTDNVAVAFGLPSRLYCDIAAVEPS